MSPRAKRQYSRDFTPRTGRRVTLVIDKVPPTLKAEAMAKAKRENLSVRALVLRWLRNWTEGRPPDQDREGEVRGSSELLHP